ncbi:uncharacterized protein LOC128808897 isoform X2 [Vidua macroura]|uniref:uncharacterized protein LOC128808897 isoform X2 n=1 Tax=Vidua macroura TaxID=187451 RepID=UPI0023A8F62A|nr:uncharacterized protein LOC128808897 isoform X2 [Vidua macroura]
MHLCCEGLCDPRLRGCRNEDVRACILTPEAQLFWLPSSQSLLHSSCTELLNVLRMEQNSSHEQQSPGKALDGLSSTTGSRCDPCELILGRDTQLRRAGHFGGWPLCDKSCLESKGPVAVPGGAGAGSLQGGRCPRPVPGAGAFGQCPQQRWSSRSALEGAGSGAGTGAESPQKILEPWVSPKSCKTSCKWREPGRKAPEQCSWLLGELPGLLPSRCASSCPGGGGSSLTAAARTPGLEKGFIQQPLWHEGIQDLME